MLLPPPPSVAVGAHELRQSSNLQGDALLVFVLVVMSAVENDAGEVPIDVVAGKQAVHQWVVLVQPGGQLDRPAAESAGDQHSVGQLVGMQQRREKVVQEPAIQVGAHEDALRLDLVGVQDARQFRAGAAELADDDLFRRHIDSRGRQ